MTALRTGLALLAATVGLLNAGDTLAQAGCVPVFETQSSQWTLQYDPLQQVGARLDIDVYVQNTGTTPCNLSASAALVEGGYGLRKINGSETVNYSLSSQVSGAELTPYSGVSRRGGGSPLHLDKGQRGLYRLSFQVETDRIPSAGLYTQDVNLSLSGAGNQGEATQRLSLNLNVASSAMIGAKGEFQRQGSTARINLGELKQGRTPLNTSIYVLSTAGYRISVESMNQGRMRLGNTGWYVPYTLGMSSEVLNLSSSRYVQVNSDKRRIDDYPLSLHIGSLNGLRAGRYSDTITFVVAAL